MRGTSGKRKSEVGLSEVVGFVMILGIIAAAASMYLTYSVPAQGRENEIIHLNEVNDEFTAYKFSIDSLISNNQVGTTLSSTFNLGTGGTYTTGGSTFLPVMQPVGSQATLMLNQRQEHMKIESYSAIVDSGYTTTQLMPDLTISPQVMPRINSSPSYLYVNLSGIPSPLKSTDAYSVTVSEANNWSAVVNVTPVFEYYVNVTPIMDSSSGKYVACLTYTPRYQYNRTDITISVYKNKVATLQNLVVYRGINNNSYQINLLDPSYGLSTFIQYPATVSAWKWISTGSSDIIAKLIPIYNYKWDSYSAPLAPNYGYLGDIEYESQNNYWIQQKFFYQMGGVFLEQNDGTSYKQAPSLSLTYDPNTSVIGVNIREIYFTNNTAIISGSSPVLVKTTLESITPLPYAPISPNTNQVNITIASSSNSNSSVYAIRTWKNFFLESAKNADLPNSTYSICPDPVTNVCYLNIQGNITLAVSQVAMDARIHGIGSIVK